MIAPTARFAALLLLCVFSCAVSPGLSVRDFLPETDDPGLSAFFEDPAVDWYDVESRPPIFQHQGRFHSIYQDIGPGGPRFSNGNGEWPWAHPSTLRNDGRTRNVIGVKLSGVREFPVRFEQTGIAITHWGGQRGNEARRINQGYHQGLSWKPTEGDIVELVTNRIGDGDYTFKVHRMTLVDDEWVFRVYRPFTSRADYERATGTTAEFVGQRRLRSEHMLPAFDKTAEVWKVPRIEPELAQRLLLTTEFELAADDDFIPTTDHANQIYPRGYLGPWIGNATRQEDCRACHRQVATNVRRFDNGEWYGQIRGGGHDIHGAGVFSWYPDRFLPRQR